MCDEKIVQFVSTMSSFLHITILRYNVDFCENDPRFMPLTIFHLNCFLFEMYSITDDENELETIIISFMKN